MKSTKMIVVITAILLAIILVIAFRSGCSKSPGSKVDQIMNVDKSFKFPPGFPSDPGEAGKGTLKGIDSDHDGLRDDLQRWIYARFPDDAKKRSALKQMAVSYQKGLLLDDDDRKELRLNLLRVDKAIQCLDLVFGDDNIEMELVQAKALNTEKRSARYLEVNGRYDGWAFGEGFQGDGTACED